MVRLPIQGPSARCGQPRNDRSPVEYRHPEVERSSTDGWRGASRGDAMGWENRRWGSARP